MATDTTISGADEFTALPTTNPITGEDLHLCIDADCPSCHWPERWFSPARRLFGCPKCSYNSTGRTT